MQTSEQIDKLAAALAKAQGAFDQIHRTREVTVRPKDQGKASYKFTYSPLDEVLRATRKALTDNGLSISHPCGSNQTHLVCGTRLMHESGQWMEDVLEFPRPPGLQEIGSALTYMRRYTLTSILGVVADEDDDGNSAEGNEFEFKDREPMPNCPKCGMPGRADKEVAGKFYCWKAKGGCGHNWFAQEKQPEPKAEPKKPGGTDVGGSDRAGDAVTKKAEVLSYIQNMAVIGDAGKVRKRMIELQADGEMTEQETQECEAALIARLAELANQKTKKGGRAA